MSVAVIDGIAALVQVLIMRKDQPLLGRFSQVLLHCCRQLVDGGFEIDEDVVHGNVKDLARQNLLLP